MKWQRTCLVTSFSMVWKHIEIATIEEFDETDEFFFTSCDRYTGHTLRHFMKISPKKGYKGWCLSKTSEAKIELDRMLH
jgi:hypothetical protein